MEYDSFSSNHVLPFRPPLSSIFSPYHTSAVPFQWTLTLFLKSKDRHVLAESKKLTSRNEFRVSCLHTRRHVLTSLVGPARVLPAQPYLSAHSPPPPALPARPPHPLALPNAAKPTLRAPCSIILCHLLRFFFFFLACPHRRQKRAAAHIHPVAPRSAQSQLTQPAHKRPGLIQSHPSPRQRGLNSRPPPSRIDHHYHQTE